MIDIIKEVNRCAGFAVATGVDIISGQPVILNDPDTVTLYAGSGNVFGLALDDTKQFTLSAVPTTKVQSGTYRPIYDRPSGDLTTYSLFFSEINRGGKVSVAIDGGIFGLLDDGRGSPYEVSPTTPYALNANMYAEAGLVTSDVAGGNPKIGVCLKTPGTDGKLVIQLRLA